MANLLCMLNKLKQLISSQLVTPTIVNPLSKNLEGHVIVITGASRGVGKATAEFLYKEGATVVCIARKSDELKKAFPYTGKRLLLLTGDVTNENDDKKITESVLDKYKKIDVLINNVGMFLDKPLSEIGSDEFDTIVKTNLKGMFLMSKYFLPVMKKRKAGFIINIGSKISHNTNVAPNKVLYAMTKYAVEGFSFALNKELKSFGIRVTCLMPGTINNFLSLKSKEFLSPSQVGMLISQLIKMKDIDFESIVFKSVKQNI